MPVASIGTPTELSPIGPGVSGRFDGCRRSTPAQSRNSSQSGEMTKSLKQSGHGLAGRRGAGGRAGGGHRGPARRRDAVPGASEEREHVRVHRHAQGEDLELFGHRDDRGRYAPFSLYSMRQAIQDGFILNVLQN
jgi:type I restriction enzyme, R subunit